MKKIWFICTGNTCRSPMAECYFKSLVDESKIEVFSAGLSAGFFSSASTEAIKIMEIYNLDLNEHVSQQLTNEKVENADMLITMTASHKKEIISRWPDAAQKTFLLLEFKENSNSLDLDVFDPIGGEPEEYARCFEVMKEPLIRLSKKI